MPKYWSFKLAEIAPFRGIRYNKTVVGDLNKVTSPPYDVISPEEKQRYLQLHPQNFVRLILGEDKDTDTDSDNRFTRANAYINDWIASGALAQDDKPSIYIYNQEFEQHGKLSKVRGFTVAVKLHHYSDKVILPHENTLAKPKSHLGPLLRATRTNLDSVYGLYADEQGVLDAIMDRVMEADPAADVRDRDGVRHQLWVLSDRDEINKIVKFMSDKQIAIADGHHRYETALAYSDEMREKSPCACGCCELPSDYALMTVANVFQKDMTIFPTHRVVDNLSDEALTSLDDRLRELFDIENSSKSGLIDDMKKRSAIGMYRAGSAKTVKLKRDPGELLEGSDASRNLELNILHKLVLERILGIDKDKLRDQSHIIYTRDAQEAMTLVDSGEKQIAFLLNNIEVKSVLDIAAAGEKMPQKATYFYPKLLSGLVLRKMD
ncbi:MAG: DUF1015 domain-containing protein [Armatimonadota bacterium]|nr:DUF1015 domain-containing protein [bacterium]